MREYPRNKCNEKEIAAKPGVGGKRRITGYVLQDPDNKQRGLLTGQ